MAISSKNYCSIIPLEDRPYLTITPGTFTVIYLAMCGFLADDYMKLYRLIVLFSLNVA